MVCEVHLPTSNPSIHSLHAISQYTMKDNVFFGWGCVVVLLVDVDDILLTRNSGISICALKAYLTNTL